MKLTRYEADTLLMAIIFQMANDREILDVEWKDLVAMRDRLTQHSADLEATNPFHSYQVSDIYEPAYGYIVEGGALICLTCASNPLYNLSLESVYQDGYPDGYTCAECDKVVA